MLFIQICYFFVCVPCPAPAFYCAWNFYFLPDASFFKVEWCCWSCTIYFTAAISYTIHIYSKSFFFSYSVVCANTAVLYTQVCEHSSSFHAAKCSSVTLIVLTFIVTSVAWLMLLCTTLYPLNASEATSFAYGFFFVFFYSMKGWGWGEGSLSACFGDMGSRQTLASCVHLSCRSFDMIFSLWIMLNIKHQYWVKKVTPLCTKKKKKVPTSDCIKCKTHCSRTLL